MGHHYTAEEWKEFVLEGEFEGEFQAILYGEAPYNEIIESEDRSEAYDLVVSEADVTDSRINWFEIKEEIKKFEGTLAPAVDEWLDKNPNALAEGYDEFDLTDDSAQADVYFTLTGAGVGIWDGRWDHFFNDPKDVKNIWAYLEPKLSKFADDTGAGSLASAFWDTAADYILQIIQDEFED